MHKNWGGRVTIASVGEDLTVEDFRGLSALRLVANYLLLLILGLSF